MTDRSITIALTADDYATANKLFVLNSLRSPAAVVGWVLFALAGVIFLGLSLGEHRPQDKAVYGGVAASCLVLLVALPLLNYFVLAPLYARRTYAKQKTLHYPIIFSWSEAGLKTENENGSWTVAWTDYLKWSENSQVILLYQAPRLFQMLPKRVLTVEQQADIRRCAVSVRR
ncbi:hypothetical protein X566_18895 [Afipia sp. P52-10]|uniref:YcxB family protein n=1 Tax=Afipia sp. P52-10 TaxID=1429916 RepID=UPI0003DF3CED|nr:YcxB family protein [Afipia sp. P52-10]ETR75861.1 hypothetical protein X566_18895 [Afipia sp. P52-10]